MPIIEQANDQVRKCAQMMKDTGDCFEPTPTGDN